MSVANLLALGSINQVSSDYITRSAQAGIKDNSSEDIESTASNIKQTAQANLELKASKIHLGSDSENILKLLSDFMQTVNDALTAVTLLTVTCTAPGNPSGTPINSPKIIEAKTSIFDKIKKINKYIMG